MLRWGGVIVFCAAACGTGRIEGVVRREVPAEELEGTWTVVESQDDLSVVNDSSGLGPLRVTGQSIVLNSDGTCDVEVRAPELTPAEKEQLGSARHSTDACLGTLGKRSWAAGEGKTEWLR